MGQLEEAHWAAAGFDRNHEDDLPIPRQYISVHNDGGFMNPLLIPRFPTCDKPFRVVEYDDGTVKDYVLEDADHQTVALLECTGGPETMPLELILGNGYLLAAAPDLRSAATALLQQLDVAHVPHEIQRLVRNLTLAVAKSNGHDEEMFVQEREEMCDDADDDGDC